MGLTTENHFLKWTEGILETELLLPFVQQAGLTKFCNNTQSDREKVSPLGKDVLENDTNIKKTSERVLLVTGSLEAENRSFGY